MLDQIGLVLHLVERGQLVLQGVGVKVGEDRLQQPGGLGAVGHLAAEQFKVVVFSLVGHGKSLLFR